MLESSLEIADDFDYLKTFLPAGWQARAKELGALRRCRKVPDAETLLRVLLIHLAEGCSLRETSVRARKGNLIELSDVAIMDRLRLSAEWFRWMNTEIMNIWVVRQPATVFGTSWNVKVVDGTRVKEPGPTGSSWLIHYSINLPSLACNELMVSDQHGHGESFTRFTVNFDAFCHEQSALEGGRRRPIRSSETLANIDRDTAWRLACVNRGEGSSPGGPGLCH